MAIEERPESYNLGDLTDEEMQEYKEMVEEKRKEGDPKRLKKDKGLRDLAMSGDYSGIEISEKSPREELEDWKKGKKAENKEE